jgi:multidrug efflux system membrane fusion protein
MRHRLLAAGLLWAAAGAAACGRDSETPGAKAETRAPVVPVTVATAVRRDVPVQVRAIGNVQALSTVSVLSQVGGEVTGIHFSEGQEVRAGDPLFSIDPRPFQAALLQAQAQRAQHQAQVAQAQANQARDQAQYDNAKVEEDRYRQLVDRGLIAREQYDQVRTNELSLAATITADRAAVETARAVVRADDAAVENAKLQLSYTDIRAPIDGRTGNLLIHQGNVVKANDVGNPLVVINRVHPILVAFSVPEQELDRIKRYRASGTLRVEAAPQGPGAGPPVRGELSFVNNTVDPATGTIQLKASFENRDNALWPGQFVGVVLTLTTQAGATVVPTRAIQTGQQGPYVFVVKPDSTVESRPVAPGITDGPDTVVAAGVAPGDQVVTDGQLRLAPGTRVDVKPSPAPATAQGQRG